MERESGEREKGGAGRKERGKGRTGEREKENWENASRR